MDTAASYPWLLSQIMAVAFHASKEKSKVARKSVQIRNVLGSNEEITEFITGSYAEGFTKLCSDLDVLEIYNISIAVYDHTKQEMTMETRNKTVLLIKGGNCSPGYVNLQLHHFGNVVDLALINSLAQIDDSFYLSSDIFREVKVKNIKRLGLPCSSTGPSNKISYTPEKMTKDSVKAFYCCHWPHDAYEWISRKRIFGWPSKCMVDKIVNMGCFIVPIGDKCSEDTHLQWRISFAAAENYLTHSLNNIQFQVYGLLKYTLQQIKDRIKHDTGEDDILCSYFMKTLMFYAVENSPQSLWQEKNIFVCFRFCLTMLIDWVQCGYCPNYFIKTNNMFKRKVHGGNKIKVLNILYELYDMKWQALSVGSAHQPSVFGLLQLSGVALLNIMTPNMKEFLRDRSIFSSIEIFYPSQLRSLLPYRKVMANLADSDSDLDEVQTYFALAKLAAGLAMQRYKPDKGNVGNKIMYSSQKKFKHWLSLPCGTDKLYLATYFYNAGSYRKVIQLCRRITSSITIEDCERYMDAFCGKGYSLYHKLNQVFSYYVMLDEDFLEFCPSDLHMELRRQHPLVLFIPPKPYAMFLSFMSYHNMGHTKERDEELNGLLAVRDKVYQNGTFDWMVHTLIGICYQTKGEYCNAIIAYKDSLKSCTERNPAMQRIEELQQGKKEISQDRDKITTIYDKKDFQ